jgi:hypothetical protein
MKYDPRIRLIKKTMIISLILILYKWIVKNKKKINNITSNGVVSAII